MAASLCVQVVAFYADNPINSQIAHNFSLYRQRVCLSLSLSVAMFVSVFVSETRQTRNGLIIAELSIAIVIHARGCKSIGTLDRLR